MAARTTVITLTTAIVAPPDVGGRSRSVTGSRGIIWNRPWPVITGRHYVIARSVVMIVAAVVSATINGGRVDIRFVITGTCITTSEG
jgi:hypothetical protein